MICPKGTECTESSHEVKTLAKAQEWFEGCLEQDLPIIVNQYHGGGGRILRKIYSVTGELLCVKG